MNYPGWYHVQEEILSLQNMSQHIENYLRNWQKYENIEEEGKY